MTTLGDLAEIVMGISPPGATVNSEGTGLPLLNGPTEFGPYHPVPTQFTNKAPRTVRKGDLLFCVRGSTTGRMNWADQEYAIGRGIAGIRHRKGSHYQPLVRGLIELNLPALLVQATGSTFPNVSKTQLEQWPVPTLSPSEQLAISSIVGALDDKIELNRKMNATLDELARTIFRSWFVDFDPVRAKMEGREPFGMDAETAALFPDRLVDSQLGPIPAGWNGKSLGDIARNVRENVPADQLSGDDPYVGLEHFSKRNIALSEWGSAADVTSNKSRFQEGDVLFGKLRPYFHKVSVAPISGVCSTDILVIRPKQPVFQAITVCVSSSDQIVARATAHSSGTRMPRAKWDDLSTFPLALPDDSMLLEQFNTLVRPYFDLIVHNVHESHTLAELRDTLLPELISGRIRAPETEKALAEAM